MDGAGLICYLNIIPLYLSSQLVSLIPVPDLVKAMSGGLALLKGHA